MDRQVCLCGSAKCCGTIGGRVEESKADLWVAKARSMLSERYRRYTPEVVENHATVAAEEANVNLGCQEAKSLLLMLETAQSWRVRVSVMLNEKEIAPLIDAPSLQALIDECPRCLKLEEIGILKDLLRKVLEIGKEILFYEDAFKKKHKYEHLLPAPGSNSNSNISSDFSTCGTKIEEDCRLPWDELLRLFKAVNSVLPVRCAGAEYLLLAYQQVANWVRKWTGGVIPKSYLPPWTHSGFKRQWPLVRAVGDSYGMPLFNDPFLVDGFLDRRVTAAMARDTVDMEIEHFHPQFSTTSVVSSESESTDKDMEEQKEKEKAAKGKAKKVKEVAEEEPEVLYCFCCLPEDEGEIKSMVACDHCREWYHTNCVNSHKANQEVVGKAAAKHSDFFLCPLCCFDTRTVSEICHKPNSEWKIAELSDATIKISASSRKNAKDPKDPKDTKESEASSNPGPQASIALAQPIKLPITFGPPRTIVSDNLSPASLAGAIKEESYLLVIGNPVINMLNLSRKYTCAWLHKVEAFLAREDVQSVSESTWLDQQACPVFCLTAPGEEGIAADDVSDEDVDTAAPSKERSALSRMLKECMQLYLELRLLKVRPIKEVKALRQLAWELASSRALFTRTDVNVNVNVESNQSEQTITANAATTSTTSTTSQEPNREKLSSSLELYRSFAHRARSLRYFLWQLEEDGHATPPTLEALKSVLDGGRALDLAGVGADGTQRSVLYSRLESIYSDAANALRLANTLCKEIGTHSKTDGENMNMKDLYYNRALEVGKSLISSCEVVDIAREYPFVCVMSLLHAMACKESFDFDSDKAWGRYVPLSIATPSVAEKADVAEKDEKEPEESEEPEGLFCYCLRGEGGPMVGCERCDGWFHNACVSKYAKAKDFNKITYECIACCYEQCKPYTFNWTCTALENSG